MRLTDKPVIEILNSLKQINWKGFKLFLIGSLLEDCEANDIDIAITGNGDYKLLFNSMEQARSLGPIDLYYVRNENNIIYDKSNPFAIEFAKSYDRGHPKAQQRKGYWKNGLFWMKLTFPLERQKNIKYKGIPMLIHDGGM